MLFSRPLFQTVTKVSTNITGIAVHPTPRPHLIKTYNNTLQALSSFPSTAVYRQATEAFTQQRLAVVESTENLEEIEAKLGAGQIEEVIIQAEEELKLVGKMAEWKPWEALETPAPEGQWDYISNYKN
ncbi:NADH dehydrogenase 1 alpha subcomplex subunit 5 NDUFA5 [Phycomyces blakesleeanus]|uniref:NADH dehydrogenase 1 alpha subcomplex subunit 5 NDUFA5 n=2 Tax=Phycomyces blakesleeanus TaxID=4837 RepID=A0A167QDZ5_PHYB8|nr:NADH dehydrogenase 1 alpha subcomplex subunit 5 NDUFA5 [Phycomyces blakesleeanus NRRL 1555(-)]OAD79559.1 NADH dehydrogenase 1 alpha subcomplex subunit 5 NDUFA5 [Phycomyces blakesleeanus NRRL 1555(-)]|eukprot:XP_018297599.1 NADH dehydrogenase 1 alpha subcomplex subunit 5 NDUFA5 [Phycomyces blakesleeanus NRRL 1555(-)]